MVSLSRQLSANWRARRFCIGTGSASRTKSQSSPCHLPGRTSSQPLARTHAHVLCYGMTDQRGQSLSQCYWFERLKWPTRRYFSKGSTACMDYCHNQENPHEHYLTPPEAISSSLSSEVLATSPSPIFGAVFTLPQTVFLSPPSPRVTYRGHKPEKWVW